MSAEVRRVAVFRNNFLPYSEAFIHDELRFHERYEAFVFALRHVNAERFPGHRVIAAERPPHDRHPLRAAKYYFLKRLAAHEREFRRRRFHLAHAYFGNNGIWGMAYARRHDLPLVVSLLGFDISLLTGLAKYRPRQWLYLLGYRELFRRAALFLAVSEDLKRLAVELGCPEEKVVVHPLGVDVSQFRPAEREDAGPPRIVMVGRFVEKKGHEYGLRAAAMARDAGHDFKLVLAGDGPLRPRYEELIRELGLQDVVELPGVVTHDEVSTLFHGAAVAMVPSVVAANRDREGAPTVAKEAAACGLPLLATSHAGLVDLVDEGATGYLVPERDAEALGRRLMDLLADANGRRAMGNAGREKMARECDIRIRARALEEYYDEVVERHRAEHALAS